MGRKGNPAAAAWKPMRQGPMNPQLLSILAETEGKLDLVYEAWANDLYDCVARHWPSGLTHLSIKRHNRQAIRDWRHLQQIKNEICGPEREGIELFPAESRLTDQANEMHLWVFPEGVVVPVGFPDRAVSTDDQVAAFNAGREAGAHKGRQRAWQPGLTTGRN